MDVDAPIFRVGRAALVDVAFGPVDRVFLAAIDSPFKNRLALRALGRIDLDAIRERRGNRLPACPLGGDPE